MTRNNGIGSPPRPHVGADASDPAAALPASGYTIEDWWPAQ